jgi:hypothetical protein
MEAVRTSETSVDNHSTRQYNPEDSSEHHNFCKDYLRLSCFSKTVTEVHVKEISPTVQLTVLAGETP